jgi:hypothetical protein
LDIVEISTVVLLCLFQGLVAGLLRPRPSLKQIDQSSSSRKFREAQLCNDSLSDRKFFLCPSSQG